MGKSFNFIKFYVFFMIRDDPSRSSWSDQDWRSEFLRVDLVRLLYLPYTKEPVKTISDIPGPISLPIIGTTWTLFTGAKGQPLAKRILKVQDELANKYGRIFRSQFPGISIISLSDPADVAKLLRSEPKYPKRFEFPVLDYYREKR